MLQDIQRQDARIEPWAREESRKALFIGIAGDGDGLHPMDARLAFGGGDLDGQPPRAEQPAEEIAQEGETGANAVAPAQQFAAGRDAGHETDHHLVQEDAAIDLADIDPAWLHALEIGEPFVEIERDGEVARQKVGRAHRQDRHRLVGANMAWATAVTVPSPPATTTISASPSIASAMRSARPRGCIIVDDGLMAFPFRRWRNSSPVRPSSSAVPEFELKRT
jgi:hypothetical protein